MKKYRRRRQKFPLTLPPVEEQDELTRVLGELRKTCEEVERTRRKHGDWILPPTWHLIKHRSMLRRAGNLCQMGGRRLTRRIHASLKQDRVDRLARVGSAIEAKLAGGNVQEAFRHLKGWYRAATETQSKPCYQTMDRQMTEWIDLYARRQSPGEPLLILIDPVDVNDDTPSDAEIRSAASQLTNGRAAGASRMRAEDVKAWLSSIREEENPKTPVNKSAGDNWQMFVWLVQAVWTHGIIPRQLLWSIVVLIPKGGRDYRGIGLLEPIWKVLERIMDLRLDAIKLHDTLHGWRANRGTGTAVIEAKLAQQLSCLELQPFYGIFLDLKKAFDAMDWERCIMILEGYGVGPRMIRLIRNYWRNAIMVCRVSGNYGQPFKAGRGVTQGDPLLAKLFNILVDAVARERFWQLREEGDYEEAELDNLMSTFFAIFYVDDAYLASRETEFLQRALDIVVGLFARVGLQTNTKKMQTMICTPGRIRTQLLFDSYQRMQRGRVTAAEWKARPVECRQCWKVMLASSLGCHLSDVHDIYQSQVVSEDLLEDRPPATYTVTHRRGRQGKLACPFPWCEGLLRRLELAPAFLGCTSNGLGGSPVGGKVQLMPSVWDAD